MSLRAKNSLPTGLILRVVALAAFAAIFCLAGYFRFNQLLTTSEVLLYQREYDEGVYAASAQLVSQGYMPYRDFLFVEPPVALYLHAAILKFHPVAWGDSTTFALVRYTTIVAGLVTLLAVAILAKQLGGWMSALLAVGLLAIDAFVIEIDRRAMLEPYINALSALALVCYVRALNREPNRVWLFSAGFCAILAALVKTTGALAIGILGLYSLGRILKTFRASPSSTGLSKLGNARQARTRELLALIAGASAGLALATGYFVITLPIEFVRQVYLLHFFRPADGVIDVADRFNEILSSQGSQLTIYFAAGGIAIILLRGMLRDDWGHWGLIMLWIVGALGIFIVAKTFYLHYVLQALVPLAILGGALVSQGKQDSGGSFSNQTRSWLRVSQVGIFIIFVLTNLTTAVTEYQMALDVPLLRSPVDLRPLRRFLTDNTPPNASVLGFEPIYALLASRQPAGVAANNFMIDSYGYLLYKNVGADENWNSTGSRSNVSDIMLASRGQAQIVGIAQRADYVVIDDRARNQLTPDSLSQIILDRSQIFQSGQVLVYGPLFSKP